MVNLIKTLTTLLVSTMPLITPAAGGPFFNAFKIIVWPFDNPDCFGKHIGFHKPDNEMSAASAAWTRALVSQEECTSWPQGPTFVGMKYNWKRDAPEDDAPDRYGKCNLTLFSDLDCKGEIVYLYPNINDPATLWYHKCSAGFKAPAKSATILCNPRKEGFYRLETWKPTGPAARPTTA